MLIFCAILLIKLILLHQKIRQKYSNCLNSKRINEEDVISKRLLLEDAEDENF